MYNRVNLHEKVIGMNRESTQIIISNKIKLIRTEADYTQDKMAEILGISKKTLVQIEKDRIQCSWTICIAVCALFRESTILQNEFGGDPMDFIELIAHEVVISPQEKTLGGHIWWRNIKKSSNYRLQQNIISKHYRILDNNDFRLISTFDDKTIKEKWARLNSKEGRQL